MKLFNLLFCSLFFTWSLSDSISESVSDSVSDSDSDTVEYIQNYPSDCTELEDGTYELQLIVDESYPVVKVKCSNGYVVLDYSLDPNLSEYFSSWDQWFIKTAGPTNDDHMSNWENWFLPSAMLSDTEKAKTSWLVSDDCSSCDEDSGYNLWLGSRTTYYMGGNIFGCFNSVKAIPRCDVSYDTYNCYLCYGTRSEDNFSDRIELTEENYKLLYESDDYDYNYQDLREVGVCPKVLLAPDEDMVDDHDTCLTTYTYKPSLGIYGNQCQCYKPSTSTSSITSKQNKILSKKVSSLDETQVKITKKLELEASDSDNTVDTSNVVHLTQDDFKYGTLRIFESGIYIVDEDISFDFNAPDDVTNLEDVYEGWKPLASQVDDYPGAAGWKDTYFLGFFAGISIEADNVILDLNDKTIGMSKNFYYQQRWFTIIELSKQYFLPGQGFANFGAAPFFAKNVIIKNGNLDLTSHHGIHGNFNKNIKIENINVKNFETHGIQFNGFDNIEITNVEVGPSSTQARLNGEYAHMRWAVDRYIMVGEDLIGTDNEWITFKNRDEPQRLYDLGHQIKRMLGYAWDYVVNDVTYEETDDEYDEYSSAVDLFVNEEGYAYASAQYGIFLNTYGASTFTYNLYILDTDYSTDATLTNVKVHGMRHKMREYVRLFNGNTFFVYFNSFAAILDAEVVVEGLKSDDFDIDNLRGGEIDYLGNALTDANIILTYVTNNWDHLGQAAAIKEQIGVWVMGEDITDDKLNTGPSQFGIGCNSDVMTHSGKGISGIRIDGVNTIELKNIEIYNLYDLTPLGNTVCGEYDKLNFGDHIGGHLKQTLPMQTGFSGNMVQAININVGKNVILNNINIHNLKSDYGPTFGVSVWPNSDIKIKGDIIVKDLYAGMEIDSCTYDYDDRPNKAPEACGFRVHKYYQITRYGDIEEDLYATVKYHSNAVADDINIQTSCINGHVGCYDFTDDERVSYASEENDNDSDYNLLTYGSSWTMIGTHDDTSDECMHDVDYVCYEENDDDDDDDDSSLSKSASGKFTLVVFGFITFSVMAMFITIMYLYLCHTDPKNPGNSYIRVPQTNYGAI